MILSTLHLDVKFESESNQLFQISVILNVLIVLDFLFRCLLILDNKINNEIHLDSRNGWVILYFIAMIICDIACGIGIWIMSLRTLGIVLAFYATDVLVILLWLDNIIQLIEWIVIVFICYLLNKYLSLSVK